MNGDGLRGRKTTQTDQDKMDIKQKDGGRQERRGVWCYADGSIVLLLRRAALAQETMSKKAKL